MQIVLASVLAGVVLVLSGLAVLDSLTPVASAGSTPSAVGGAGNATSTTPSDPPASPSSTPTDPSATGPASTSASSSAAAPSASSSSGTTSPTPVASVPVVFLGDGVSSIDSAAGRSDWTAKTTTALADSGAPVQRTVVADDGAGYVKRSTSGQVLSEQAASVVTRDTGVVVLLGSRNDLDQAAAVGDTARVALATIRAQWPGARVVVIAPVPITGDSAASTSALTTVRNALRSAAAGTGATFVDPLADGWVLGPGTTASSNGRLRLTAAGQTYLAQQVVASVRPLVVSAGAAAAATASPTR